MKKMNLNIEVSEDSLKREKETDSVKVVVMWIGSMIERAVNKPNPETGRPTGSANMQEQRKFNKVMDALEGHKEGIANLEDDIYTYMQSKFNQAQMPLHRGTSKLLGQISNAIDNAKDPGKDK